MYSLPPSHQSGGLPPEYAEHGITVLPDSKIRFRFGYDQNTMYGPGFSTTHEGTD
jgi:hypothetical protein